MGMTPDSEFSWLEDLAFNDYSQFGEDGVLQAIFSVIGAANQWCFECGAADGLFFSNTRRLIEQGWRAVLVEADPAIFARLVENNANDRVSCFNHLLDSSHRIDAILHRAGAPLDIDLVVVDVDGQDYYLFNAIVQYRPRVVMVEFDHNADEEFIPTLGGPGQAGSKAIEKLVNGKFYQLVHATTCNGIFVHQTLARLLKGNRSQLLK
jgi:hypothetical protein